MKWSKEDEAALTKMWCEQGLSIDYIAGQFGVTRNAIAGKIGRMGMQKFKWCPETMATKVLQGRIGKRRELKKLKKLGLSKSRLPPSELPPEPLLPPASKPVPLINRSHNQCSYLIGYHTCCGNMIRTKVDRRGRVVSTSWCPYHYRIVYQAR